RVFADSDLGNRELAAPAVVAERGHLDVAPGAGTAPAMQQQAAQPVVTVAKDVRFHGDRVAAAALDRKLAAIHDRKHVLDHRPAEGVYIREPGHAIDGGKAAAGERRSTSVDRIPGAGSARAFIVFTRSAFY